MMDDYELLDFGDGRRLERFGPRIADRPCPAAENVRKESPAIWNRADFRFVPNEKFRNSDRGRWTPSEPEPWPVAFGPIRFELRGTPFGHVGVFPEQQENWRRLSERLADAVQKRREPIRVLNLFAYTGGGSLAAALVAVSNQREIEVVHVDSAGSAVDWARRNAERNGISRGIRYIVEDVRKFVGRELKRNNRYDAVILDPPSYGHGVKGEPWKIDEHLPPLLAELVSLLSENPVLFLLTAHSPLWNAERLRTLLLKSGLPKIFDTEIISMDLATKTGRKLPSGYGVLAARR